MRVLRRELIFVAVLIIILGLSIGGEAVKRKKLKYEKWTNYQSKDNLYKVKFPCQPEEHENHPEEVDYYARNCQYERVNFIVEHYNYTWKMAAPPADIRDKEFYDSKKEDLAEGGVLYYEKNVQNNRVQGLEYSYYDSKGFYFRKQVYVDPTAPTVQYYKVFASSEGQFLSDPDVDHFFQNFKILRRGIKYSESEIVRNTKPKDTDTFPPPEFEEVIIT